MLLPLAEVSRFALGVAMTLALGPPAESEPPGLRVSLDVRDTEATQIARAVVEAAGRQAVVGPSESCRLTLKLRDVPWKTALSHVLEPCGLVADLDGDVLLIAGLDTLTRRAREARELAEARRGPAPRRLVTTVRLSYARAEQMAETIRRALPPGAEVAVDARTNTLIIVR